LLTFQGKNNPFEFDVGIGFRPTAVGVEGGGDMPLPAPTDPRPTDPPFLFVMLLAARKAGDRMLESLAHDWLAELGIRVVFSDTSKPKGRQEVSR
jgi:hypothetical protein